MIIIYLFLMNLKNPQSFISFRNHNVQSDVAQLVERSMQQCMG